MIWILGGYMWLFIHRPFEVWPVLGTLHIERIYMIFTILCWAVAAEKSWTSNRLNVGFLALALTILASAMLNPYENGINQTVEDWLKIAVFYVLVLSVVRTEDDLKRVAVMFVSIMGLYMLHSLREFLCGRNIYHMGVARMVGVDASMNDPNTFSTILYALPMVYPLWSLCRNNWQKTMLASYVVLSVLCILLTGSRSSFIGICALFSIVLWFSKHRTVILICLAALAPVVWVNLREDLQNRFLTIIDPSYGPKNAQVSAESRWHGWHDGVQIWQDNVLLGCGPGNFGKARGYALQSHQLYGQILGELGTLGVLAFALIAGGFYRNAALWRKMVKTRPELANSFASRVIAAVSLAVVLLLIMGFAGHNLYRYTWLWYGAFEAIALAHFMQSYSTETAAMPEKDFGQRFALLPTAR